MLYKETQNSLMDFLLQIMPDLKGVVFVRPTVSKQATKTLMSIWKNEKNKISERRFKRPSTLSTSDISEMETNGLIKTKDEYIDVTEKGAEIIKTIILGDERSSFEDDDTHPDYETALANTKPVRKMVRGAKKASVEQRRSNGWYQRMKNGHSSNNGQ
jgi:hypothetical protein